MALGVVGHVIGRVGEAVQRVVVVVLHDPLPLSDQFCEHLRAGVATLAVLPQLGGVVGQFVLVVPLTDGFVQRGQCVGVAVELGQDQRLGERRLPGRHGRGRRVRLRDSEGLLHGVTLRACLAGDRGDRQALNIQLAVRREPVTVRQGSAALVRYQLLRNPLGGAVVTGRDEHRDSHGSLAGGEDAHLPVADHHGPVG
ncbi:hypothetical protein, partial [Curtobacterium flaccumfaciens]|uniref:hypothetical protein n=1 Tax=Curtobacterium flaccumfaciens TaxID=2035 RepID=UPI00265A286E